MNHPKTNRGPILSVLFIVVIWALLLFCVLVNTAGCATQDLERTRDAAAAVHVVTTQPAVQGVAELVPGGDAALMLLSAVAGAVSVIAGQAVKRRRSANGQ